MTLVIAVKGVDLDKKAVIIVGSDSHTVVIDRAGNRVDTNNTQKIYRINNYLCVLSYGNHEVSNTLLEYLQSKKRLSNTIGDTSRNFGSFCKSQYELFYTRFNPLPQVGFILAGFDKVKSKYSPKIYHLCSENNFFPECCDNYAIKGKPNIAEYLFNKIYTASSLPLSEELLYEFVCGIISETISVDGDVGGDIKLARINQKRGFDEVYPIDGYLNSWKIKYEKAYENIISQSSSLVPI